MRLINYRSKYFFWRLWIEHTVLIERDKVLSYEPIIFWRWKFYLYNKDTWIKQVLEITSTKELPDIWISKYEDIESNWVWCFEAIYPILKKNNIDIMETLNNRTKNIIKWILIIMSYTILVYFMWFFTNDYIEEILYDVVYVDNIQEICEEQK